jgi:glutamate synthase domain-containing protein 3
LEKAMKFDAKGLHYRELNERLHSAVDAGEKRLVVENVNGHRYIGTGMNTECQIELSGTPGNDLGAFMNGPRITVRGNAQDVLGNTMSGGRIAVHGHAGDLLAHSLRGGTLLVRDSAGYRVGIHMKAFGERVARVVVGGKVGDYAGEYMSGGVLVVLGLTGEIDKPVAGKYLGTGMHGGEIYVRGSVTDEQLGKEVGRAEISDENWEQLSTLLADFAAEFDLDPAQLKREDFVRLIPTTHRPYGTLYVY